MPSRPDDPILIRAERVLAGDALEVAEPATVLVEGGLITEVATEGPGDARRIELPGTTLLPGFIDAHVHIGFARPQEILFGGVTTVRDLAWPVDEIFPLASRSREPGFRGPYVIAAGQMLTVPKGYPMRAEWAPPGTGRALRDPEDAVAAVDDLAERGACVIKVALVAEDKVRMPPDVLEAIVSAAHSRSLGVTGHVRGLEELGEALDAGLDELAHMLLTDEAIPDATIELMVERDLTIVPTLAIRSEPGLEVAVDNLARFAAAGGRVVYGTDLGNSGPRPGIDRFEIAGMARAGLDGRAIMASATTVASAHLGLDDRGTIAPRRAADLIAVEGDPLEDPMALLKLRFVMRDGRIHVDEIAAA